MSTTPNPDYPNSERLARLMRAFDNAFTGKYQANVTAEELRKAAQQQMEAIQLGRHEVPTITYVPRQKNPRRSLNPFSMIRYIRDNIRLRKYNDEWIKNNVK